MPPSTPEPALLVASILGRTLELCDQAAARFAEQFGRLIYASEPLGFEWTQYYRDELGETPARRIVALDSEGEASRLPDLKRATGRLEVALRQPGRGRAVNIDPGYLTAEQLVLASTKPRRHRIHLGRGIYGDLMLLFGPDGFAPLPWTYPDYASPGMREIFARLRELLLQVRRARAGAPETEAARQTP